MNKIEFLYNKDKYQGIDSSKALSHYGILGQKWGQRRWQNADGTFNEAGKERYFGPSGTTKKNKEEIEKIGGKYTKEQLRFQKYIASSEGFNLKYQRANGHLTEKGQKLLEAAMNGDEKALNKLNKKISPEWYNKVVSEPDKKTKEFFKELITKNKQNEAYDNEGVEGLDKNIKVTKNLKGKDISDEEFDKITKDTFESVHDLSQKDYDEIADLGLYRMIQNGSLGNDAKPGDEGSREWFMEEDQTIGYPQIVDFYRKGYSKDYVEKYLQKINDKDISIYDAEELGLSPDLIERSYWPGSAVDDIYDNGSQDQKIGGLFNKDPQSKEAKQLSKEAEKIEKSFIEKWNGRDYYDSDKIDEWLDKEENKKVEEIYNECMEKAFGETSKELKKIFKDYDDNEADYTAQAAICDAIEDSKKLRDLGSEVYWFLADDGDQNERNSLAYYMNDKGYNQVQIADLYDNASNKLNEGYEVGSKLSKFGNPVILQMSDKAKKEIYDQINYRWEAKDNYTFNKILEASEGGEFNKQNMKTAKEISKKMAPSCAGKNNNGWFYFNQAVNNLDLGGKDYTELTQADWDRINAEINSLKR